MPCKQFAKIFVSKGNGDRRFSGVVKKLLLFCKKDLQFEKKYDIILSVAEDAHRGIAQLVEYRSPKPWVAGSNPPAPAKIYRIVVWLSDIFCYFGCFSVFLCPKIKFLRFVA